MLRADGRAVIDGKRVAAARGETFDCVSPIDGRVHRARSRAAVPTDIDAAVASARRAFDDGRWAQQAAGAAQARAAALRRKDPRREGRAGAARDARHGQADPRFARGRRAAHCAQLSPGTREAVDKLYDEIAPTPAQCARADHARADGRDRRDRAVELPDDHGVVEARPGARGRQFDRAQAEREESADGAAAGRAGDRGRAARRRVQRRAGLRPRSRRGARAAHGRRCDRLHRLDARRPPHARVRRPQQPEARLQRARRQVGVHRVRRLRRPRARREDGRRQHVLQPGRKLQRAVARARAREHRRRVRARSSRREAPKYQPADPLDPATAEMGAHGRRHAAAHRARLHRCRPREGGASVVAGGTARARGQRRLLRRADGVRPRRATT